MKRKITSLIMCAVSCAMVAQTTGEEAGHTWMYARHEHYLTGASPE